MGDFQLHLHLFETKEEHDALYESGYTEPWVGYVEGDETISYNKIHYPEEFCACEFSKEDVDWTRIEEFRFSEFPDPEEQSEVSITPDGDYIWFDNENDVWFFAHYDEDEEEWVDEETSTVEELNVLINQSPTIDRLRMYAPAIRTECQDYTDLCPCELLYAKPMNGYYPLAPDHDATKVGSIAYFDGREIKFVAKDDWNRRLGTPIGVLVIPASHMPDGKCRVMSLCNMSYVTPETGSLAYGYDADSAGVYVTWGAYSTDTPLVRYPYLQSMEEGTFTNSGGFIPSDYIKRKDCIELDGEYNIVEKMPNLVDTKTAWWTYFNGQSTCGGEACFAVSPYLDDGSQNPLYLTEGQLLSDMDGASNTETLMNCGNQTTHSAARMCQAFSTPGTHEGDWYLPAAGELGYVAARFYEINKTLIALGENNAVKMGDITAYWDSSYGSLLWCSSRKDSYYAWSLQSDTYFSPLDNDWDYGMSRARAFIALDDGSVNT